MTLEQDALKQLLNSSRLNDVKHPPLNSNRKTVQSVDSGEQAADAKLRLDL